MGRIRSIKPEFSESESLSRVSRDARLLFVLLWTIVDDSGRQRGGSRYLASKLYPHEDVFDMIDEWLDELERESCVRRYVFDNSTYIEVTNWSKHQRIDKPSASKFPTFEDSSPLPREDSLPIREEQQNLPGTFLKGSGSGSGMEGNGTRSLARGASDCRFDIFWEAYPKKKAKDDCLKAWKKLKPDDAMASRIMVALSRAKSSEEWERHDGRFIPYGATWLNGKRFDDDLTPTHRPPHSSGMRVL